MTPIRIQKPFEDPTFLLPNIMREGKGNPACKHECILCEKDPRLKKNLLHLHECKKCGKSFIHEAE